MRSSAVRLFVVLSALLLTCFLYRGADAQSTGELEREEMHIEGRSSNVIDHVLMPGRGPSFLVLHRGEESVEPDRFVSIFHPDEQGNYSEEPSQVLQLNRTHSAVSVGNYSEGPRRDLLLIGQEGVDLYSMNEKNQFVESKSPYVDSSVFFRVPDTNQPLFWKHSLDLNDDDRTDLILPGENGYRIYMQNSDHGLDHHQDIPLSREHGAEPGGLLSSSMFVYRTRLPNLLTSDLTGNGYLDIIYSQDGQIVQHNQDPEDGFSSLPSQMSTMDHLEEEFQQNRMQFTAVRLADMNRSGVPEIIVTRISGQLGVFRTLRTRIYIFFGRPDESYSYSPDQIIRIPGVSVIPELQDANGDGYLDIMVTALRTDALTTAWNEIRGEVDITHYLYLFNSNQGYLGTQSGQGGGTPPDFTRDVQMDPDLLEDALRNRPHMNFEGDFNGDGRPDLLTINAGGDMEIFLADEDIEEMEVGFESSPRYRNEVESPRTLRVEDFLQNGDPEVLIRHADRIILFQVPDEQSN